MSAVKRSRLKRSSARRPVSRPQDTAEREATRAAEEIAHGGSVASWSFSKVAASSSSPVHRQLVQDYREKTEEEKKKEAVDKTIEAVQETPQAKALKEKVLADPLVKTVKDAATSTPGMIVGGAAAAGGVAALAATGKELPMQPPAIPLDKITPGLSAQVKYEGPVNAPTYVGLTLTFTEQGPKATKKTPATDKIAADIARVKAQEQMVKPAGQKQQQLDPLVLAWVQSQPGLPGLRIPLVGTEPKTAEGEPKKEEEPGKTPVQPAPASPSVAPAASADVDDALASPGRPLEPSDRRSMEARFGHDFSNVRIHDDARAAATAAAIDAAAFTVGEDVVFAPGRYDPRSDEGRRLLAHELAHVVQQDGRERPQGGSGRPLDPKLRAYFEPRFGVDLGRVRVHTGAAAADSAQRLRARAYTVGSDVVFGANQYDSETQRGRWLVAHELAHVAQSGRPAGVAGTTAVERDASAAATAAVTGKRVRIRARRSGADLHRFGEPDNTPDLTFVSTSGKPGFLNQATQYHQTWGLSPQRFNSMQALLATLAAGTGTIGRLRIVSHADFDNIFTPLFDGGSPGITVDNLNTWAESDPAGLRRVLQGPLVKRNHPMWSSTITSAQGVNPAIFQTFGIDPASPPTTGPIALLLDAAVDLITIRGATGGLTAKQRATFDRALTQELDGLRAQVVQQLPTGSTTTAADVQALQDSITGLFNIAPIPRQDAGLMAEIAAASSGVASGFRTNLTAVRARINGSTWIDIRGCRVGQKPDYLKAVATFFGTGTTKPHVSGPEWWQSFPQLGWHSVADAQMTRRAAERNVRAALEHWADVTGLRDRLHWWRMFLMRVLQDDTLRSLEKLKGLMQPPALLGGLTLTTDPLLIDFTTDLPPLPKLEMPEFGAGVGFQRPEPGLGTGAGLQNPWVPVAKRDLKRYGGADGLFRYYMDAGLPLPVQEGANVELMSLLFKVGREKEAIDAWTASEWGPAAPGLAAVQSGAWTRDEIRRVEAVVNLDKQRRALAMYISPDPRYAAHVKTT